MTRRFTVIVFIGVLVAVRSPVRAGDPLKLLDPPQGQFADDWMLLMLGDEKVGYANSTITRNGDTITARMLTVFSIARADNKVEISMLQTAEETVDGHPREFESATKMGIVETRTRGVIADGKVKLSTTQFGQTTDQTSEFPPGAVMTWGSYRITIEKGFAPGTTYDIDVYEPAMSAEKPIRAHFEVGEKKTIDVLGKQREAVEIRSTLSTPQGEMPSVSYVDDKGNPLRVEVQIAGLKMTMVAADREIALREFNPPEFFVDTLVPVDRSLDRGTLAAVDYTIRVNGAGRKLPPLPPTAMQTPGESDAQSAKLRVRRVDTRALRDAPIVPPSEELNEFLVSSASINSKDPAIIEMAANAAGDETRPYYVADRLRTHVTDIIKEKSLAVGFGTASEVCRNREGDCTEHAVLLAALGRARGIPTRVVVGLAYVPSFAGKTNVFGFHMWTQFNIAGQWIDLDAALRETDCSPARIALATSGLNDVGIGEIAFAIMDVITGLKIEIVAVEER
ncbi:MAG: transglutaminase family protein [Phycisphaerales bacterium]|nr:transglutaminase family protein [Phycisphaerales bacterium]